MTKAGREPTEDVKRAFRRAIEFVGLEVWKVRMIKTDEHGGRWVVGWAKPEWWKHDSPAVEIQTFVKFSGKVGMNAARVRASWLDERLAGLRAPLFITHAWQEADGAEREHTEQVASAEAPHRYTITCGQEPQLRSIRMHVPSLPVEG